jgi:hypothetical protein
MRLDGLQAGLLLEGGHGASLEYRRWTREHTSRGGSQGPYIRLSASVWLLNEMALLGERWPGWLVRAKFPMGRLDGTSRCGSVGLLGPLTRPHRSMVDCAGAKGGDAAIFMTPIRIAIGRCTTFRTRSSDQSHSQRAMVASGFVLLSVSLTDTVPLQRYDARQRVPLRLVSASLPPYLHDGHAAGLLTAPPLAIICQRWHFRQRAPRIGPRPSFRKVLRSRTSGTA